MDDYDQNKKKESMDDEWMVLDGSASMTLHVYGHSSEAQARMPVIVTESSMGTVRGSQFEW